MSLHDHFRKKWNEMLRRWGKSHRKLAEEAGVEEHKLRSIVMPRIKDDKGTERQEIVSKVRACIPEDEASTFSRFVAEAQAGVQGDVVESLREELGILRRKNQSLSQHNEHMEYRIQKLERLLQNHHTPATARLTVRRSKR